MFNVIKYVQKNGTENLRLFSDLENAPPNHPNHVALVIESGTDKGTTNMIVIIGY